MSEDPYDDEQDENTSLPDDDAPQGGVSGGALPSAGAAAGGVTPGVPGAAGTGLSSAKGIAKDVGDIASGAVNANPAQATDATVRAAATGVALWFGGPTGGDAARAVLDTGAGKKATKLVRYVAWGTAALMLLPILLMAAIVFAMTSATTTAVTQAVCFTGATPGQAITAQNPTPEEVAGQIYAQAHGFGYGDYAVAVMLVSGQFESGLSNIPVGDYWTASSGYSGMTGSRGLYQQFPNAAGDLAWSGKQDPGYGKDNSRYDESNAWGPDGWATSDPRMNVAQAANIFILGMGAGSPNNGTGYWGMDSPYMPYKDRLTSDIIPSADEVWRAMHYVQGFNPNSGANQANAAAAYDVGIEYLKKIKEKKITVPPFVPPLDFLADRADSDRTKAQFGAGVIPNEGQIRSALPVSVGTGGDVAANDGITFLGDSVMVGMLDANRPPKEMYGGPVVEHALVGISLEQVLTASTATASDTGKRDDITKWRDTISTGPSRILVELGTNPSSGDPRELIADFMELAGPSRDVYWFSQHYDKSKNMQAALEEMAGKYRNLHLIPVLELLPGGTYTSQLHPYDAYPAMWARAMDMIGTGGPLALSSSFSCGGYFGGAVGVNPGSSALPYPDKVLPSVGWTMNVEGGRNMAYYNQGDSRWEKTGYPVGPCGCGPTAFAMIVATLSGQTTFSPLQSVPMQMDIGGLSSCGTQSGPAGFVSMGSRLGLKGEVIGTNWTAAKQTLQQGGLVIASMASSVFTSETHYIVLRGLTADGKILVADPASPERTVDRAYSISEFNFNLGMATFMPATVAT